MISKLVSIYFGSLCFGHTIKTSCIQIQVADPGLSLILAF